MLPSLIYKMCVHGALIVGSRAKYMAGETTLKPNDYDLLVPPERWQTIAMIIPKSARLNSFGGWRFALDDGTEVDVWPGSLTQYLTECKTKHGGPVVAVDYINNRVFSSILQPLRENK